MMQPTLLDPFTVRHSFVPIEAHPKQCQTCGGWQDASYHSLELFTDADHSREEARLITERDEMETKLRSVKADISRAVGILERESPLFYGKGENPCLW